MVGAGAGPHGWAMTTTRLWSSALCSLVPCFGLLAALLLSGERALAGGPGAVAVYLGFVAVPSMVAIASSRSAVIRVVVTVVMTGVAVFAGVQMPSIDDGQAGLAVIWVPTVAFPLALVVGVCEEVLKHALGEEQPFYKTL